MKKVKITCADALAFLEGLPPQSVDLLMTDPPYSSGGGQRHVSGSTARKYCKNGTSKFPDFVGDTMDQHSNYRFSREWLMAAKGVMRDHAYIGLFCDWRQFATFSDAFQAAGFHWHGVAVWDKTQGVRPQLGAFRSQCEFILWGTNGGKPKDSKRIVPGVKTAANVQSKDKHHQTQKPVEVMEWLLSIAPCDDAVVCDPFMGSGSTGIAALNLGHRFWGCELNQAIFETAKERLMGL